MGRVRTTILAVLAALMVAMLALAQVASAQQAKTTGGALASIEKPCPPPRY